MKFITNVAPSLKQKKSTKDIMLGVTMSLLCVYVFATINYILNDGVQYAIQVWLLLGVSLAVTLAVEALWASAKKQNVVKTLKNSFGWITSLILVLMCPINTSFFAIGVGTFVAIFFGKLIFGGFGQNIFNPAGLGKVVMLTAFSSRIIEDLKVGATPLATMSNFGWLPLQLEGIEGGMQTVFSNAGGLTNLLLGTHAGAIGETSIVLLVVLGIIMAFRKVIDYRQPVLYLTTIFVFASIVGIVGGMQDWYLYALFHIISGGVVFGAVFMLTDPVTNPTSITGRIIFPVGAAFLTVLIRLNGNFPEGCVFSILTMNALTPLIESFIDGKNRKTQLRGLLIAACVFVIGIAMSVTSALNLAQERKVFAEESKVIPTTGFNDEEVLKFEAKIDKKVDNGDGTFTYEISAQGYHALEDQTQFNRFEIVVDKDLEVVSVKVLEMVDTEYVGDKIENQTFLDSLVGMNLEETFSLEISDAVSGATYSVRSVTRALYEVYKDLYKEPEATVVNQVDNGDGTITFTVSSPGYHALEDSTAENEFEIKVADGIVKSVKVTKMADTEYIGDKIENQSFLTSLEGLNLKDVVKVESSDVVSGATYSVKSVERAFVAVAKALGY